METYTSSIEAELSILQQDNDGLHLKVTIISCLPLQLMKAAVPAESYVIHLSSASLVSCDVYGQ